MKSIFIGFLLTNLVYQQCLGYVEKRTFRERSKIHCSKFKNLLIYEFIDISITRFIH